MFCFLIVSAGDGYSTNTGTNHSVGTKQWRIVSRDKTKMAPFNSSS